ncbi:hypothetical protein FQA39_LY18960 [Lamprigera yunnana]|nr:hypothetical protein FQA39_LY18960 [Lamprigera yunnana]
MKASGNVFSAVAEERYRNSDVRDYVRKGANASRTSVSRLSVSGVSTIQLTDFCTMFLQVRLHHQHLMLQFALILAILGHFALGNSRLYAIQQSVAITWELIRQHFGTAPTTLVDKPCCDGFLSRIKHGIDAVHFALDNDDGGHVPALMTQADLILIGFWYSSCKLPITEEDLDDNRLPAVLKEHKNKPICLND